MNKLHLVGPPLPGWTVTYLDAPPRPFVSPDAAMGYAALMESIHQLTRGEQLECRVDCGVQTITLQRPALADILQLGKSRSARRAEFRRLGRLLSTSFSNESSTDPASVADGRAPGRD